MVMASEGLAVTYAAGTVEIRGITVMRGNVSAAVVVVVAVLFPVFPVPATAMEAMAITAVGEAAALVMVGMVDSAGEVGLAVLRETVVAEMVVSEPEGGLVRLRVHLRQFRVRAKAAPSAAMATNSMVGEAERSAEPSSTMAAMSPYKTVLSTTIALATDSRVVG